MFEPMEHLSMVQKKTSENHQEMEIIFMEMKKLSNIK
jgi:hypothetical protein